MPTYNALTVTPAYGRDYRNAKLAVADWNKGNDFLAPNLTRTYVNASDLETYPHGFTHVRIRYAKLTKVIEVKL